MNCSVENFGIVKAKLSTNYTRLIRFYSPIEWDVVGFYYPGDKDYELILYDYHSGYRIRGITSVGSLLVWDSVLETGTMKFYLNEEDERNLRDVIACLLFSDSKTRLKGIEDCIRGSVKGKTRKDPLKIFYEQIGGIRFSQTNLSIYKRTTPGASVKEAEVEYEGLHDDLFLALKKLNSESYNIFQQRPLVLERELEHPTVSRLYKLLKQASFESLAITKEDVDLGETPFKRTVVVEYSPKKNESLQLKCVDFEVVVPLADPDLSLIDRNTLKELLGYIENCNDQEKFGPLERSILEEIGRRNRI